MKYIIEIAKEYEEYFKGILICGIADGKFAVDVIAREDLEELNSDYINEHFGQLQDEAYQRGYEDGKNIIDNGCEGCKYTVRFEDDEPCKSCSNRYKNKYEPTPQEDDRIEAGDIVERYIDGKLDSKGVFLQEDGGYWRCLFDTGAVLMTFAYPKGQFKKTGKHYNIASILEAIRNES